MPTEEISKIVAYIAIAVPATVAVANIAKVGLEWIKQRHSIRSAEAQQSHQITTHYLDRALDPTVPLAIRHQLLRFLATPDKSGSRLRLWAESELKRIGGIVDETNLAVASAERELHSAKSAAEVATAERKLEEAVRRQRSLLEPPVTPSITPASLRAGFIDTKELSGLQMEGADLTEASLSYRNMRGANFAGANLTRVRMQGCDLRAATFAGATLDRTVFYDADLRGADISGAVVTKADFERARLEGADMRCQFSENLRIPAVFDDQTRWPEGFDPVAAGAIKIDGTHEAKSHE